jgi:hypothetical protein
MNYSSLALAALGATVAGFAFGGLLFVLAPGLIKEAHKYPAIFRTKEEMTKVMPVGLFATFVAILVAAIFFAMIHPGGAGLAEGARFGVLLGLFVVCGFVLHNYVNLNVGLKFTMGNAVADFIQWTIIGIVIALIYKPHGTP